MKYVLIVGWFILAGLCVFDNYSTYIILQDGGQEINPFMNWLMGKLGIVNALTVSKLFGLLTLLYCIYFATKKPLSRFKLKLLFYGITFLIGFYTIIMYSFNLQYILERNLI